MCIRLHLCFYVVNLLIIFNYAIFLNADSNYFFYVCTIIINLILFIMRNFIFISIFVFFGSCLLESCYAFLKADKLVYAGTVAKRPVEVSVDTAFNAEVIIDADK